MTDSGEASAFPNWDENSPMAFHAVEQHQKRNDSRQDKSCFYPACKENLKKKKKNDHKNLLSNQAYLLICGS